MEEGYAQALWTVIAKGTPAAKAIQALTETLKAHGRLALSPRIAKAFERIAQRESVRTTVVLTVAREKDAKAARTEALKILEELESKSAQGGSASGRDLKTEVDDTVIGGWRLEGRGILVDASHKKQLLDIFSKVTA